MTEEKKGISRREFLKDASLIVGGAAVGSTMLGTVAVASCNNNNNTTTSVGPSGGGRHSLFKVNGIDHWVEIEPYWSLNFVIREKLGLTFTKMGCDRGECGHCTVLVNDLPIYSCMMLAQDAIDKPIETAEILSPDLTNLDGIAKSFRDNAAFQCGFCTAGWMIATKALLKKNPSPNLDQVREELAGHLCICSGIIEICQTVVKIGQGG
ncbi:MAG: 2Fe-2S iron-sulfur cluster-binding protein [Dehalococcoidia bacterium]|nr:2Fe-2S iron-sulfur cluster-binding protein [Dehalococcoidia bacterium]